MNEVPVASSAWAARTSATRSSIAARKWSRAKVFRPDLVSSQASICAHQPLRLVDIGVAAAVVVPASTIDRRRSCRSDRAGLAQSRHGAE